MTSRDKFENLNGFERDKHSRGIVSTDSNALKAYKIQRKNIMKIKNLDRVEDEIADIKSDINEIKDLLIRILNNK